MSNRMQAWGLVAVALLATAVAAYFVFGPSNETVDATATETFEPQPAEDAAKLSSGIRYSILEAGDGEPVESEYIRYRMEMYTADGTRVMSSEEDGAYTYPVEMLQSMVPGIAEALLATPVGETRRYWIEAERLKPGYPNMADSLHVIDLTVLEGRDPLPAPEHVAAAPDEAQTTDSGIAYVVLQEGPEGNTASPVLENTVTVHYTGWTTDGEMFDSSELRGTPAEFPLARLIPGWQQAIPLMTVGDRYRFWIPGELAYDNSPRPGAPKGMLVFDIELLNFTTMEESGSTP